MIIPKRDENANHKILVQKKDIKILAELNIISPAKLFLPFIMNRETINDDNQYDFLEFEDFDEELNFFFKGQNWIIRYNTFFNFSPIEFQIFKYQLIDELNSLKYQLKYLVKSEKERQDLIIEIKKKKYYLDSVIYFESIKNDKEELENISELQKSSK